MTRRTMTPEQVRWAASHDWFVADMRDGSIVVRDETVDRNGKLHVAYERKRDFVSLRRWAGY